MHYILNRDMEDYKHLPDGDLDIQDDLFITESTYQHQRDLLLAAKGHIRDMPERGVGSVYFLSESDPEAYFREIKKEMTLDGMTVRKVGFVGTEIELNASYENNSTR